MAVVIWPDIGAQELLRGRPTHRELRAGHRRRVEMVLHLLHLPDGEGRPSAFRGREGGDFFRGRPDRVAPRRFWWAIPSVFRDPGYPYRVMVSAQGDARFDAARGGASRKRKGNGSP